jgi:hypothetical protein
MSKIIFEKEYCAESTIDMPEDIGYMDMTGIPVDKYGLQIGTFTVTVTWKEDENE